jgi:hypothetical protein
MSLLPTESSATFSRGGLTRSSHAPANIPSLNQAIEPFRESYDHIWLVICFFQWILHDIYEVHQTTAGKLPADARDKCVYEPWQHDLSHFCSSQPVVYRDPESMQVAQVLAKMDPLQTWTDLEELVRLHMHGADTNDQVGEVGECYTPVYRGKVWLVDCALLELANTTLELCAFRTSKAGLESVVTRAPIYGAAELDPVASSRHDLFGPGGVLWSVMELFTRDPDDHSGIEYLLHVVMQQALQIARIFEHSGALDGRAIDEQPSYKWHFYGLEVERNCFRAVIGSRNTKKYFAYHIRDGIKDLDFINLWDSLWQKAKDPCSAPGYNLLRIAFDLCKWVFEQALLSSSGPHAVEPN